MKKCLAFYIVLVVAESKTEQRFTFNSTSKVLVGSFSARSFELFCAMRVREANLFRLVEYFCKHKHEGVYHDKMSFILMIYRQKFG
jgi:hypothetical protein